MSKQEHTMYMENVFPLYRWFKFNHENCNQLILIIIIYKELTNCWFWLQFICVYNPTHAFIRCKYIFLEALQNQLPVYIRIQARNRIKLPRCVSSQHWCYSCHTLHLSSSCSRETRFCSLHIWKIRRINSINLTHSTSSHILLPFQYLVQIQSFLSHQISFPLHLRSSLQGIY